jgi:isoleucyl-tRNA synthetase
VLIWTTTPWTIPSNLAVAFHPDYMYAAFPVVRADRHVIVVIAKDLRTAVAEKIGATFGEPVAEFDGRTMERLIFRHPLYKRDSLAVLGDYVTLEAGTGVVHTAPGHGADDYHTGVKYGLDIYGPLDAGGHFLESVELFAGLQVYEANPKIEAALAERGRLWHRESYDHQYPHCWRCHNPVIFLATSQWFIAMEAQNLRQRALKAIDDTRWIPAWGHDRIYNMIAHRPDWCISRQRVWGVPIPAVDCKSCGQPLLTRALVDRAAAVFERHSADAWYERPIEEFLPEGLACSACGGKEFERESNILDVWFDSGSSHEAVLPQWPDLQWPADLYLEGSDQHRGWFHSSLLVGLGTRGRAPFNQVLTHGFLIDLEGRKMSKSVGNAIMPMEVIQESGAEILRLWVAMSDYSEELRVSKEILTRVVDAYRKIRNVLRVLAGNLYDFDPHADAVPRARLLEIDRWAMAKYAELAAKVVAAYDDYAYPVVYQAANQFITVDLSAFYVDVTKDRMYTFGAKSEARRSGQTAMYSIAEGLSRLLAPILPFTMDELWRTLPGERDVSVHLALFPSGLEPWRDEELLVRWAELSGVRDRVNVALEEKRQDKTIRSNLSARVRLGATGELKRSLESYVAELPALFGVSQVDIEEAHTSEPSVFVDKATGVKCERCWRYVPEVSTTTEFKGLCERCVDALAETVNR